jgi:hypothetical protein
MKNLQETALLRIERTPGAGNTEDQGDAFLDNATAQYRLGLQYAAGFGVTQDVSAAATWFRKAADQGHTESRYLLEIAFRHDDGIRQDPVATARWLRRASENEDKATIPFKDRVRRWRVIHCLSLRDAADLCGVSAPTLLRAERGDSVSLETRLAIGGGMGDDRTELMNEHLSRR